MRRFFFNDTAATEIYTLSLHDALPISRRPVRPDHARRRAASRAVSRGVPAAVAVRRLERGRRLAREQWVRSPRPRSEEHMSELQSRQYLVCRLLLEKKYYTILAPCMFP